MFLSEGLVARVTDVGELVIMLVIVGTVVNPHIIQQDVKNVKGSAIEWKTAITRV